MADFAKTIFTERVMKRITFKTLNAPAKAGGFYQLMENKTPQDAAEQYLLACNETLTPGQDRMQLRQHEEIVHTTIEVQRDR